VREGERKYMCARGCLCVVFHCECEGETQIIKSFGIPFVSAKCYLVSPLNIMYKAYMLTSSAFPCGIREHKSTTSNRGVSSEHNRQSVA